MEENSMNTESNGCVYWRRPGHSRSWKATDGWNWKAVLSYFIPKFTEPHPNSNYVQRSQLPDSHCSYHIRTQNSFPYTRDHRLLLVRDHLLATLKLVLILVTESEVWLPNVTHIADGLFIYRISLLVFYFFSFTKLIFIVGQGYKCWCVHFHLTHAGLLKGSHGII